MLALKLSTIGRPPLSNEVIFSFNHYRVAESGGWTIPDLVRYLISVQSSQQTIDIARFWDIPAFSEEATTEQEKNEDGTPKKFKASDLYQPLDVFRDLGLPIIDWQGKDGKCKWRPNSKEGILNIVECSHTLM